jgi:hypothetical protein
LPLYLLSDPPPPPPKVNVQYIQPVCGWGGGEGVLNCVVDHIQQEFNTLFLTRFRTYKIATPPQTKHQKRRHLGIGVFIVLSSMGLILFVAGRERYRRCGHGGGAGGGPGPGGQQGQHISYCLTQGDSVSVDNRARGPAGPAHLLPSYPR